MPAPANAIGQNIDLLATRIGEFNIQGFYLSNQRHLRALRQPHIYPQIQSNFRTRLKHQFNIVYQSNPADLYGNASEYFGRIAPVLDGLKSRGIDYLKIFRFQFRIGINR